MSAPDRLSEALLGLLVIASKGATPDADLRKLVDGFLKNWPELRLVEPAVRKRLWNLHRKLCKEHCSNRPKLHEDPCAWFRDDLLTLGEKP